MGMLPDVHPLALAAVLVATDIEVMASGVVPCLAARYVPVLGFVGLSGKPVMVKVVGLLMVVIFCVTLYSGCVAPLMVTEFPVV